MQDVEKGDRKFKMSFLCFFAVSLWPGTKMEVQGVSGGRTGLPDMLSPLLNRYLRITEEDLKDFAMLPSKPDITFFVAVYLGRDGSVEQQEHLVMHLVDFTVALVAASIVCGIFSPPSLLLTKILINDRSFLIVKFLFLHPVSNHQ